jgi:hypothetical protein
MSIEEPDLVLLANLRLEVREAFRRGRWAWQIVDARNGSVFERAFEFVSEESARRSGLARLAEVLTPLRGARDILQLIAGSISTNHLVIVSRDAEALHQQLLGLFREGTGVDVIRDRRHAERRRYDAVKVRGWCVIARADVPRRV